MAELKPKLRVDVNHNPTKKGIKVQFVLPQTLEGDAKAQATQKLQSKLNQGLEQYNLTVSQDTDVPYSNVIGFLIPIADIKLLIKNAIGGGAQAEPAPEEAPAPEEPVKENRNQQMLDDKMLSFFSPVDPTELPDNLKNINTPVVEDEKAYFTLDGDSLKIYYKRGGESSFDLTNNVLKTSPHLKAALKSLQKGSMNEIKRMQQLAGLITESQLQVNSAFASPNEKPGVVDIALVDKLLKQIGPYLGYSDWREKIANPDYKGIIQQIAKHVTGTGTLGTDRIKFSK